MGLIYETLSQLGLTSKDTQEVFSLHTRDVSDLIVYRDKISGVIYIDDYYSGDEEYKVGRYREDAISVAFDQAFKIDTSYKKVVETQRRYSDYKQFIIGMDVADLGCAYGEFLRLSRSTARSVQGIELQQDYVNELQQTGIPCCSDLSDVKSCSVDSLFCFHAFEHFPDPLAVLKQVKPCLSSKGKIIFEVPHANDFLLNNLKNEAFMNFTLLSQHLVLHTRESLRRILEYVGFKNITIEGVQRYSIGNHFGWLVNGKPGGHQSILSVIENEQLVEAYESALCNIDATDTIVAIA